MRRVSLAEYFSHVEVSHFVWGLLCFTDGVEKLVFLGVIIAGFCIWKSEQGNTKFLFFFSPPLSLFMKRVKAIK